MNGFLLIFEQWTLNSDQPMPAVATILHFKYFLSIAPLKFQFFNKKFKWKPSRSSSTLKIIIGSTHYYPYIYRVQVIWEIWKEIRSTIMLIAHCVLRTFIRIDVLFLFGTMAIPNWAIQFSFSTVCVWAIVFSVFLFALDRCSFVSVFLIYRSSFVA